VLNRPDFRAVFDAMASPYVLLDADFAIVDMNQAYLDVTMRRREDLLGRNLFEAFPGEGESYRMLRRSLERVRAEGVRDVLALIPYAIARPAERGGGFEERFWSATHAPIRDASGAVTHILQHTQDVTELQRLRDAAGLAPTLGVEVLRRAEEVQQANQVLAEAGRRLRHLVMQAPGFICVLRGPDHVFELANNAYLQLTGHRDVVGKPIREALPEVAGQGYFELLDNVLASREAFVGRGLKVWLQRSPGAPLEERFVDLVYQPVIEADGTASGIFVEGSDVTEQVQAQNRQRLLLDELNHRVKNTLATVQAIAVQTLRTAAGPGAFIDSFQARLKALARTHDLLTMTRWQGADLRELLWREFEPFGTERVRLQGSAVLLPARVVLALGLVVHELATNAAKYGALAVADGRLDVTWSVSGAGEDGPGRAATGATAGLLHIIWSERGGPPPATARPPGFGTRLIERSIAGELGGTVEMNFDSQGLQGRLTLPLQAGA